MYQRYQAWQYVNSPPWLQLGVAPVSAGFLLAEPNYEVRPRILPDYYLVWIRDGSGTLQSRGKSFSFSKGALYMLFPNIVHAYQTCPDDLIDMFWIGFQGVSAGNLVRCAGFTPDHPLHCCKEKTALFQALERMAALGGEKSISNFLMTAGALEQVFGLLLKEHSDFLPPLDSSTPRSAVVTMAHHYVNTHYPEAISIAQLASTVGVSRATLAALFRCELGQTPSEYICYVRMQSAISLLLQTELSIEKIAGRVGFNDPLYFSKVFSAQYGVSPSRFRKLVHAESPF